MSGGRRFVTWRGRARMRWVNISKFESKLVLASTENLASSTPSSLHSSFDGLWIQITISSMQPTTRLTCAIGDLAQKLRTILRCFRRSRDPFGQAYSLLFSSPLDVTRHCWQRRSVSWPYDFTIPFDVFVKLSMDNPSYIQIWSWEFLNLNLYDCMILRFSKSSMDNLLQFEPSLYTPLKKIWFKKSPFS